MKDRDRKPVLLNTDNVNKLLREFNDGQERNDESRNLHENEFLYCGNWAEGMWEVTLTIDRALSFFNGRKSASELFEEFRKAGLLKDINLCKKMNEKAESAGDKVDDDSAEDKRERKKAKIEKTESEKEDDKEGQTAASLDSSLNKEIGKNYAQLQEQELMGQKKHSMPTYENYSSTHRKQLNSPSTAIPNLLSLKK